MCPRPPFSTPLSRFFMTPPSKKFYDPPLAPKSLHTYYEWKCRHWMRWVILQTLYKLKIYLLHIEVCSYHQACYNRKTVQNLGSNSSILPPKWRKRLERKHLHGDIQKRPQINLHKSHCKLYFKAQCVTVTKTTSIQYEIEPYDFFLQIYETRFGLFLAINKHENPKLQAQSLPRLHCFSNNALLPNDWLGTASYSGISNWWVVFKYKKGVKKTPLFWKQVELEQETNLKSGMSTLWLCFPMVQNAMMWEGRGHRKGCPNSVWTFNLDWSGMHLSP